VVGSFSRSDNPIPSSIVVGRLGGMGMVRPLPNGTSNDKLRSPPFQATRSIAASNRPIFDPSFVIVIAASPFSWEAPTLPTFLSCADTSSARPPLTEKQGFVGHKTQWLGGSPSKRALDSLLGRH